ncbi:MAG: hypothetical protein HY611_09655, partial [Elusimicrobia bacterium]|nr:hypothetical protein [Elusimicrobiota bacterium]
MTFVNNTQIRANVILKEVSGDYFFRTVNPDGRFDVSTHAFAIPPPKVTSVAETPSKIYLSTSVFDLNVVGDKFMNWTSTWTSVELRLGAPQTEVSVASSTWLSTTTVRASVALSPGQVSGGPYDVRVRNPEKQIDTLLSAWSVPAPSTGTAFHNDSKEILRSSTFSFVVKGSDFMNWPSTWTTIYLSSSATLQNGQLRYATADISTRTGYGFILSTSATAGQSRIDVAMQMGTSLPNGVTYYFQLRNPTGQLSSISAATMTVPAPEILQTYEESPKKYLQAKIYNFIVEGKNFMKWSNAAWTSQYPSTWTQVQFIKTGDSLPTPDITINSNTFEDFSTFQRLTLNITLNPSATFSGGPYDVKAINPNGQFVTAAATFTIVAPSTSSVRDPDGGGLSGGIQSGLLSGTRDLTFGGAHFSNWGGADVAKATFTTGVGGNPPNGIIVSSVTYISSTSIKVHIQIATYTKADTYGLRILNPTQQMSSLVASTFTVTVPSAAITFPAFPTVLYSTGLSAIQGTANFNDVSQGVTLSNTEIKVTIANDPSTGKTGYIWSAGNFQAPATFLSENSKWNAASASSPWAYSGGGSWPGSAAEQKDGYTYDLNARGHGSDEGYGLATSTLEFTIDKLVTVPSVTNPAGGVPTNSVASINGSVQDSGAGVSSITIRIGDLWSASSPLSSPASYWNTTTGVWQDGVFESTVFVQGAPPFPSLQGWSRTTVLPAWQSGRKYRIENLAMDALGQTTSGGQIATIDFIYDVTSPTETMTTPVVSADVDNPNWVNNFTGMSGAVQDDVTSALNTRTVYV